MLDKLKALETQIDNVYRLCVNGQNRSILEKIRAIFLFYVRKIDEKIEYLKLVEAGKVIAGFRMDQVDSDPFPPRSPEYLFLNLVPNKIVAEEEAIALAISKLEKGMDIFAYLQECQRYRLALAEAGYPTTILFDNGFIYFVFDDVLLGRGVLSFQCELGELKITIKLFDVDNQVFRDTTEITQIPELLSVIEEWQELYPD